MKKKRAAIFHYLEGAWVLLLWLIIHPCAQSKTLGLRVQLKNVQERPMLCYAESLQSCPTLWDPIDGSPPGSPVLGILQARTLQWVAISFSNAWKGKVKVKSLICVRLFVTPWSAAYQAPPYTGLTRQDYCSGLPFPPPEFPYCLLNIKEPSSYSIN